MNQKDIVPIKKKPPQTFSDEKFFTTDDNGVKRRGLLVMPNLRPALFKFPNPEGTSYQSPTVYDVARETAARLHQQDHSFFTGEMRNSWGKTFVLASTSRALSHVNFYAMTTSGDQIKVFVEAIRLEGNKIHLNAVNLLMQPEEYALQCDGCAQIHSKDVQHPDPDETQAEIKVQIPFRLKSVKQV